jgi:hypothetical protein
LSRRADLEANLPKAGEFSDRDGRIRARQVVGAISVATRDKILDPEQEVVESQPIPDRQQRSVIDVGEE